MGRVKVIYLDSWENQVMTHSETKRIVVPIFWDVVSSSRMIKIHLPRLEASILQQLCYFLQYFCISPSNHSVPNCFLILVLPVNMDSSCQMFLLASMFCYHTVGWFRSNVIITSSTIYRVSNYCTIILAATANLVPSCLQHVDLSRVSHIL
jgi:hypothetical protein